MTSITLTTDARGVTTLTFARREARNAFGAALVAGLTAAARAVPPDAPCALMRDVAGRAPADVRRLVVDAIARIRVGAAGQEGLRAFLDKRAPRWQG